MADNGPTDALVLFGATGDLAKQAQFVLAKLYDAFVGTDAADTAKVMAVCKQFRAEVPVLIARDQVDEEAGLPCKTFGGRPCGAGAAAFAKRAAGARE